MDIILALSILSFLAALIYTAEMLRKQAVNNQTILHKLDFLCDRHKKPQIIHDSAIPYSYNFITDLCEPTVRELAVINHVDERAVYFNYKNMNFVIVCPENKPLTRLYMPAILELDANDKDIPAVLQIANDAETAGWGTRFVWRREIDKETGKMKYDFSLVADVYFSSSELNPTAMLKSYLDGMMDTLNYLHPRLFHLFNPDEDAKYSATEWKFDDNIEGFSQGSMN